MRVAGSGYSFRRNYYFTLELLFYLVAELELISCFQKHDFQIFNGEGVGGGCQNLNVAKIWLNVRIISSSLLGGNECMFQGRGYFCMSVFIVERYYFLLTEW